MSVPAPLASSDRPRGLALMFGWRRLRFVLGFTLLLGTFIGLGWKAGLWPAVSRVVTLGLVGLVVFGVFEQWPRRLPRWIARWVLQVAAVALTMPFAAAILWALATEPGAPPFYHDKLRMQGFSLICGLALLLAPWVALAALVRQKDALARHQALEFELARSELQRQALDARMHLLQAQVAPHFLFNTLANVQALVDAGSAQASAVLRSLVAYLRAAVPRLHEPATTLGQELQLVQAYLELMHMRMPDRLRFELQVDPGSERLRCPPMTLLTLVENAVRHGIDPSEEGGLIRIEVRREGALCRVRVCDSGMGLGSANAGLGTGLSSLRERLQLSFGERAQLRLSEVQPHGVCAEIEFPAQEAPA
jgi:signal transduction histidine kinase